MAFARTSLRNFLGLSKSSLRAAITKGENVTIVMGNESADLDSLTSALLFAYVRSNTAPADSFTKAYIPLLNIPSADIQLRPEYLAVLRHANVPPDALITLDDLPTGTELTSKLPPERTKWILVDHNVLQGQLGRIYADRVGGVIDHHDDEGKIPSDTTNELRIITRSGSCTSLVTNYVRPAWDQVSAQSLSSGASLAQSDAEGVINDAAFTNLWDAQLAKLSLASVLIDTNNLQDKSKVTEHDVQAVHYLEAKIALSVHGSKGFDRTQYFQDIFEAKQDIEGLSFYDVLRKDYKEWKESTLTLGISSVVRPVQFLADKAAVEAHPSSAAAAFSSAINNFADDRSLDLFAIMTTWTDEEKRFRRELMLLARGKSAIESASRFQDQSTDTLGLVDWDGSVQTIGAERENTWQYVWQQQHLQHSRKQVAPLLRQAMNG